LYILGRGLWPCRNPRSRGRSRLLYHKNCSVVIGGGEFRIEIYGLVVIRDRAVEVAFCVISIASVGIGGSIFRIEIYSLVEIGNRAVQVALFRIIIASVVIGGSVFRIEANGLVIGLKRSIFSLFIACFVKLFPQ